MSTTKESLGIFWEGEEVDGILVYGFWPRLYVPKPLFPKHIWAPFCERRSRSLLGEYWTIWVWEIHITCWPAPHQWIDMIVMLLKTMIDAQATIAWLGLEGFFVEPPGLLDYRNMSGGVWAAMTHKHTLIGLPQLDVKFVPLSDDVLEELRKESGISRFSL